MPARKITYFIPVEIKFTAIQMNQIVTENMETWCLTKEQAEDCTDEDILVAASRLGFIEIPINSRFDDKS